MLSWLIGDVRVTRVVETVWPISPRFLFDQVDRAALGAMTWLRPHFVDDEGRMLLSIHALIVESQGKNIIVDTCLGNDKRDRMVENWNLRTGDFLAQLTQAGFGRERIDTVLCTHMHVDHVGWNTMLVDGQWVPTFSNARYLYARNEWEHAQALEPAQAEYLDSVKPVLDAGLVDVVDSTHAVTDEVTLEPTPGHTVGHVSVHIKSKGEEAVITGDMTHHPCQFQHPDWSTKVDYDRTQSSETRQRFYAQYADRPVLIIGTHFATPTAGHIVRDGDAYRLAI
ncbi:MAG: glyoxylase-like metal-dependent hydrolase (beta-lactamase superfamily II) [Gammaproteobacteria bacterium]|jgi:glyoxylase-like metal-dependent hydrolase (beta-lactamase superfamily II)